MTFILQFFFFEKNGVLCSNFYFKISVMIFHNFVLIKVFEISAVVFYFIFAYFVRFLS